jgi:hypothetical protein
MVWEELNLSPTKKWALAEPARCRANGIPKCLRPDYII